MQAVSRAVRGLGFDPYVATMEQTLAGLNENVLRHLEHSEYIVFVDFARTIHRDRAGKPLRRPFPRSLYSHQELAVAAYLRLDPLIFQERRPKDVGDSFDGFLIALQGNCKTFSNRAALPALVARELRKKMRAGEWRTDWRREVNLRPAVPAVTEAKDGDLGNADTRYYHLEVVNGDWRRTVWHCAVHVVAVQTSSGATLPPPRPIELKFDSVRMPDVLVPAAGSRKFAILRMPYDRTVLRRFVDPPYARTYALLDFNVFLNDFGGTYSEYLLPGPETYDVTLRVTTDLFPEAIFRVRIRVGSRPETSWVKLAG